MVTKARAIRSTMSFGIVTTQFILGLNILANIFSSNKIVDSFLSGWGNFSLAPGYQRSGMAGAAQIEDPIRFLFAVLGFMIIGYVLIIFLSTLTGKKQKARL